MSQIFEDRTHAGRELAKALQLKPRKNPLILALPRGGVPVAAEVCKVLKVPVDMIFVRKLGAPFNQELGIGALVEGTPPQIFLNEDLVKVLKVDVDHIEQEKYRQLERMKDQQKTYRKGNVRASASGREVILIDDGIATGASVHAALKALKSEKPHSITLAVPVCAADTLQSLKKEVDEVICLLEPKNFKAVGQFYRNFHRVEDQEVIRLVGG